MMAGTQAAVPGVVIVHDKFHISQDQNKALDEVRRAENKRLMGEGDERFRERSSIGSKDWNARTTRPSRVSSDW